MDIHDRNPDTSLLLAAFIKDPRSCAFLFHGSNQRDMRMFLSALQFRLNAVRIALPLGDEIALTMRAYSRSFREEPAVAHWRLFAVEDSDFMSEWEESCLLYTLENLPPRVVICFTTNDPDQLNQAMKDRMQLLECSAPDRRPLPESLTISANSPNLWQ